MERSRKILCKIVTASHQVMTAANDYADRKDLYNVERVHFQLEEEMQRISVACECLAKMLPMSLLPHGPVCNERLKDWLTSDEPRMCCETLDRMETLLKEDASLWANASIRVRSMAATRDKIDEAVNLFESRKRCFHFLFAAETWDNESSVQRQKDVDMEGDCNIPERGHRVHVPKNLDTVIVPEKLVHDDGHTKVRPETKVHDKRKRDGRKLLKWLDGLNCAEKQDITLSLRQPDTCKWLFDTIQYKTWRDSRNSFLWLRGKPGAGKSVLASSVIDSLESSRRDGEFLVFFYCDFRNERSTHGAEVMRSILSQLLRQHLQSGAHPGCCAEDLTKAKERGGATLKNAKQLAGFVSHITEPLVRKPLVIVDALDECKDARELLQALMLIKTQVRLFITSRPVHAIVSELSGLPLISMDDTANGLSADIELHVTRELDARPRLRDLDTKFKTEIRTTLCKMADGMFRWVQCSIDTLNRCVTRKEVRTSLNNLPEGLDETYERILRAIDMHAREGRLARRALVWLVAALRPLHLDELMEGLSINLHTRTLDPDVRPMNYGALLDACGSLVTLIERTGVVILSHFSVKEYLMGEFTRSKLPRYHVNWELAHLHVARSCMCYISICLNHTQPPDHSFKTASLTPGGSPERRDHLRLVFQPFREYVLDHAPDHFSRVGPQIESILREIRVLEQDTQAHSRTWDNMCLSAMRFKCSTTPSWPTSGQDFILYILIAFCPNAILRKFLRYTGLRPKEGTNPLVYAAYFNKDEHARTLLSKGAKLNLKGLETNGSRQVLPIEVALQSHHNDMVTLFVAVESPIPSHIFTAVHDRLHTSIPSPVLEILLQTDDFAEAAQNPLFKPSAFFIHFLHSNNISEQDVITIIRRIIQVGYDPFAPTSRRDNPIRIAIQKGYITVTRYLLSLGVSLPSDILVTSNVRNIPNRAQMVRFLVDSGANTLARTPRGDSVLHITLAAHGEDDALEIARLLVARGCDPLEVNSRGETAIFIAIERGHVSVVYYFISLGISLPFDLLAISRLWRIGNRASMIRYLVEHGANVFAHTSDGDSVLHVALAAFDEDNALEMARFLVSHGCDPLEANSRGQTPLCIAIERGHVSVARYLLSLGMPLPSDLLITLRSRSMWVGTRMIRFLVENGVGVLERTPSGDSVFNIVIAAVDEHDALETAKFLVTHGCDPLQDCSRGQTPLRIALLRGHVSVSRYLLSLGTLLAPDLLITLISRRMLNGARTIRFLVEHGVDVLVRTRSGDSVLHIVLAAFDEHNALETTKFLVKRGCDPLQANSRGETPLRIAVDRRHVSVACYLLSLGVSLPADLLFTWSLWRTDSHPEMIRALVENGANVTRTSHGNSLLHIVLSAFGEHDALETAKLLVARGCDPRQLNSCGEPPIYIAVERGHISVARYLVSLGVPLPSDLFATLGSWRGENHLRMIRFLVEIGANIFARTSDGDSLLHAALTVLNEQDALQVAKLLVTRGCDPLEADSRGETPICIAVRRWHILVARYFISLGIPCDVSFITFNTKPLK